MRPDTLIADYDDVASFLESAAMRPARHSLNQDAVDDYHTGGRAARGARGGQAAWTGLNDNELGVTSFDGVARIARQGWPRGLQRLQAALGALAPDMAPPRDVKRRLRWADQGDMLDMQRVYCGQLDSAWRKTARTECRAPRRITLAANCNIQAAAPSDWLFWRGAAVARAAELLEDAGFSVRILYVYSGRNDETGEDSVASVCIKAFGAPIDLLGIASTLCLPAFTRVLAFAWRASHALTRVPFHGMAPRKQVPRSVAADFYCDDANNQAVAEAWIRATVAEVNNG